MLAAIPFLLCKAACANAVAPPALAPVDLNVSSVLAKAISVCSICISAACVATPKLAKGLDIPPLKSEAKLLKFLVSE